MSDSSELTLELTDIIIKGTAYPLLTSTYEIKGKGEGANTAKKVVGGAGLGALIGGLAGAGEGTAVAASKKGQQTANPQRIVAEISPRTACGASCRLIAQLDYCRRSRDPNKARQRLPIFWRLRRT